ncbi:MAG: single-stranded DNA-binding protein, partial [Clostridia bacterium]
MNKVILIGNLTRDVELNVTTSGLSVAKFSIAVSRKFKNADGDYDVDFINIVAWRDLAERCEKYLHKGNKVGVVGSMQTRT